MNFKIHYLREVLLSCCLTFIEWQQYDGVSVFNAIDLKRHKFFKTQNLSKSTSLFKGSLLSASLCVEHFACIKCFNPDNHPEPGIVLPTPQIRKLNHRK